MAVVISLSTTRGPTGFNSFSSHPGIGNRQASSFCTSINKTQMQASHHNSLIINKSETNPEQNHQQDNEAKTNSVGVEAALTVLKFYKREISPLLPKSCRYVPTCSEYSMEAYKKYGVVKGTILTAWRLCRCNPLGGSGFDPPLWFDEEPPPQEE